jgi:hypothetical protein
MTRRISSFGLIEFGRLLAFTDSAVAAATVQPHDVAQDLPTLNSFSGTLNHGAKVNMFDWNSVVGMTVRARNGAEHELGGLLPFESMPASFRDRNGTAVLRIWNGEDTVIISELKRRITQLDANNLLGLSAFSELELDSGWFGYSSHSDPGTKRLAHLIHWDRKEPWLSWYDRFGLQSRLRAACNLCSLVSQWSTTGYARCEWPLFSFSVRENGDVSCDDPESFSRSNRARMIARRDSFALAPELLNGSRQPDPLTDAFSLAVTIYSLLKTTHPFGGAGLQSDIDKEWRDDPKGDTADTLIPTKLVLTKELRKLFSRCFVDGRQFRFARPSADEWQMACRSALDRTAMCGTCHASMLIHSLDQPVSCAFCGGPMGDISALEFFEAVMDERSQPNRTIIRYDRRLLASTGYKPVDLSSRHCQPGQPDGDRNQVLAHLVSEGGEFVIKNASACSFYVCQPGSNRFVAVPPAGNSAFPTQSRIMFDRPQPNRTVKGARFVTCRGTE